MVDELGNPPPSLASTRIGLHRLATYVIAPARYRVTGRFGLRSTPRGFGTPVFEGRRIRVEGRDLIDESDGTERRCPITSLRAAAEFLAVEIDPETAAEHDSPPLGDPDEDLRIDAAASGFLGQWYAMAFAALEELGTDAASVDASEPQLWPGHFDAAIEVGDEVHRASYGASPGDHAVAEPYLYVAAWWPDRLGIDFADGSWNGEGFTGTMMRLAEVGRDRDPVATVVDFWRRSRDRLHSVRGS